MSRCHAITKKGTACKAQPLKGTDFCLSHSDAETRESVGFVADNGLAGRKPTPRVVDVVRERIERDMDAWYQVLLDARDATRTVMVGHGDNAYTETVPDHQVRLAAFREAMDRAYGKPKQMTEVTGADGGPLTVGAVDMRRLSDDELADMARLVERARVIDADAA